MSAPEQAAVAWRGARRWLYCLLRCVPLLAGIWLTKLSPNATMKTKTVDGSGKPRCSLTDPPTQFQVMLASRRQHSAACPPARCGHSASDRLQVLDLSGQPLEPQQRCSSERVVTSASQSRWRQTGQHLPASRLHCVSEHTDSPKQFLHASGRHRRSRSKSQSKHKLNDHANAITGVTLTF